MELQELVARGRLLFSGAPKRFAVFELVNGRRLTKEIARKAGRSLVPTLNDLKKMKDFGLISAKKNAHGKILKKEGGRIYEKNPLLQHLSKSYFKNLSKIIKKDQVQRISKKIKTGKIIKLGFPTKNEVLNICKDGENQIHEFKRAGVDSRSITKEICAFSNTKMGGLILYGVEDDGSISGIDQRRQVFDQRIQNSVRNSISPALSIAIKEYDLLGYKIFIINVSPWNRKNVYQYEGRVYIRKGTNVFVAKPEELKMLHQGQCVI